MTDGPPPGPPPPPPPPPPGYGAPPPPGAPSPAPAPGGRGRTGLWIAFGAVVAVVVAVVAIVALSGGDDDASDPADLSLADLEPALLTEEDVGGDYTLDSSGGGDDDGDSMDMEGVAGSDECREVMEPLEENANTNEEVGVEFVDDFDGTVGNTLGLLLPGEPTLAEVRAALEQCDTMTFEDEGATGEVQITIEDVEGLGDDAIGVGMVLDMEVEGLSLTVDSYGLLWEHDGVAADLFAFGGLDERTFEPIAVDEAWVRDLAQTVDGRITEIVAG